MNDTVKEMTTKAGFEDGYTARDRFIFRINEMQQVYDAGYETGQRAREERALKTRIMEGLGLRTRPKGG